MHIMGNEMCFTKKKSISSFDFNFNKKKMLFESSIVCNELILYTLIYCDLLKAVYK